MNWEDDERTIEEQIEDEQNSYDPLDDGVFNEDELDRH